MKLLYLDIDGVLNSTQITNYYYRRNGEQMIYLDETMFCPAACANLQTLCEDVPTLRVVLSSSWRLHHPFKYIEKILNKFWYVPDIRIIGETLRLTDSCRGDEILEFSRRHEASNMLILDDDTDMGRFVDTPYFLHVDSTVGFDYNAMLKAKEHLKLDKTEELKGLING